MRLFIHVGLHKTGTTFLQREIFPNIIKNNKNIDIISKESFSGDILNMHSLYKMFINRFTILEHLHKLYPSAKIILGVREKSSWLDSLYRQYIKQGGTLDYINWFDTVLNKDCLDTEKYIRVIKETFDDIFIYHFEELKKDTGKVIDDMCNFMGCNSIKFVNKKYNVGWNDRQIALGRFLNKRRWAGNPRFWVDKLSGTGR